MHKTKANRKKRTVAVFLVVLAIALLTVSGFGIWDYLKTTRTGDDMPSSEVVSDVGVVSEKPVTVSDAMYTVPSHQPRTIQIPRLGINAYVQKVGIEKNGAMSTPSNINFAGWYINSRSPGESGVSIINGHAGGRYSPGVFLQIGQLQPTDKLYVQMGDMTMREFSVLSVNTYSVAEASTPLFNDDPLIDKELHLITCDGVFNDQTQSYDKRTVVVARYVGVHE